MKVSSPELVTHGKGIKQSILKNGAMTRRALLIEGVGLPFRVLAPVSTPYSEVILPLITGFLCLRLIINKIKITYTIFRSF